MVQRVVEIYWIIRTIPEIISNRINEVKVLQVPRIKDRINEMDQSVE